MEKVLEIDEEGDVNPHAYIARETDPMMYKNLMEGMKLLHEEQKLGSPL